MNGLMGCIGYLAVTGILSFLIGRAVPKKWFDWESSLFQTRPFEQDGRYYDRFYIRKWKDSAPDMNKILPALIPGRAPKSIHSSRAEVEGLLRETCVAELTHAMLILSGAALLWLWPGVGGIAVYAVYVLLGNVPFIMIQRYNRPRFARLLEAAKARERRKMNAGSDTVEQ